MCLEKVQVLIKSDPGFVYGWNLDPEKRSEYEAKSSSQGQPTHNVMLVNSSSCFVATEWSIMAVSLSFFYDRAGCQTFLVLKTDTAGLVLQTELAELVTTVQLPPLGTDGVNIFWHQHEFLT